MKAKKSVKAKQTGNKSLAKRNRAGIKQTGVKLI